MAFEGVGETDSFFVCENSAIVIKISILVCLELGFLFRLKSILLGFEEIGSWFIVCAEDWSLVYFEIEFWFRSKSTFVGLEGIESWVFVCEEGTSNSHQRLCFWYVLKFSSKTYFLWI